jgi:hypothetical protein
MIIVRDLNTESYYEGSYRGERPTFSKNVQDAKRFDTRSAALWDLREEKELYLDIFDGCLFELIEVFTL